MISWIEHRRRRARRRKLFGMIASVGALTLLTGAVGALLPAEHRSVARGTLALAPEGVWRVLTDLDGLPLWRSDIRGVERLPDREGRPSWREVGREGIRVYELAELDPPRKLVMQRLSGGSLSLPRVTVLLQDAEGGTVVTVTELGAIRNPLGRVLVRLGARDSGATRFLEDLAQRIGGGRARVTAREVSLHGR